MFSPSIVNPTVKRMMIRNNEEIKPEKTLEFLFFNTEYTPAKNAAAKLINELI